MIFTQGEDVKIYRRTFLRFYRAQTLPPIEHQDGRREKLIARSREKYAAKRVDVEAKIERWMCVRNVGLPHINKGRIPFLFM